MKEYTVTITGEHTEYSSYTFNIKANSLEAAQAKAKKLAEDENGEFADDYADYCDPGDSYETFTVQEVKEGGK